MKPIKYLIAALFALTLFSLWLPLSAKALTIGVSPSSVINEHLRPGMKAEFEFRFMLNEQTADNNISITGDFPEFDKWVTLEPGIDFVYPKGQKFQLIKLKLAIPSNAVLKSYAGTLRINAKNKDASGSTAKVIGGTRVDVKFTVSPDEFRKMSVHAAAIATAVQGQPISIKINVNNQGNIATALSRGELEVTDLTGNTLGTFVTSEIPEIEAFTQDYQLINFKTDLAPGQYRGTLKLYFQSQLIYQNTLSLNLEGGSGATDNASVNGADIKGVATSVFAKLADVLKVLGLALICYGLLRLLLYFKLNSKLNSKLDSKHD